MRALFAALMFFGAAASSNATVVIDHDHGGHIAWYQSRYENFASHKDNIVIDGICYSSCTLVLRYISRERVCVTKRGELGFHSAWFPFPAIYSEDGTKFLWNAYPEDVRALLRKHGWNGPSPHPNMIRIVGAELRTIYKQCPVRPTR